MIHALTKAIRTLAATVARHSRITRLTITTDRLSAGLKTLTLLYALATMSKPMSIGVEGLNSFRPPALAPICRMELMMSMAYSGPWRSSHR
ncbi:hypothetical protein D3C76_1260040 [compost metagenome]